MRDRFGNGPGDLDVMVLYSVNIPVHKHIVSKKKIGTKNDVFGYECLFFVSRIVSVLLAY